MYGLCDKAWWSVYSYVTGLGIICMGHVTGLIALYMQYDRRCCSLQAVSKYFGVKSIAMYGPYIAGVGIIVRYCGCPSTLFDR